VDEEFDFEDFFANIKGEVKKDKVANIQVETPIPNSPRQKDKIKEPISPLPPLPVKEKEITPSHAVKKTISTPELPRNKNSGGGTRKFVFERRNSTLEIKKGLEDILTAALARSNQFKKQSIDTPEHYGHLSLPNKFSVLSGLAGLEDLRERHDSKRQDDAASDTDSIGTLMTLQKLLEVDAEAGAMTKPKKHRKKRRGDGKKQESDDADAESDEEPAKKGTKKLEIDSDEEDAKVAKRLSWGNNMPKGQSKEMPKGQSKEMPKDIVQLKAKGIDEIDTDQSTGSNTIVTRKRANTTSEDRNDLKRKLEESIEKSILWRLENYKEQGIHVESVNKLEILDSPRGRKEPQVVSPSKRQPITTPVPRSKEPEKKTNSRNDRH